MTTTLGSGAASAGYRASGANLVGAAVPVFSLMAVITRSPSLDSLRDLRGTAVRLLEQFRMKAAQEGAGPDEIDAAVYALAATLDELSLTRDWNGRLEWQESPLAKTYCRDDFVGVGFYEELDKIRRTPGDRTQLLEIYSYCLAAGFRGQYADQPSEYEDLVRKLAEETNRPGEVVPTASLERRSVSDQIREFPYGLVLLTCFTVAFVWYVVASLMVNGATNSMSDALRIVKP